MKVVHFSTSDNRGGAARSAYRLHQALREHGTNSSMIVAAKESHDPSVLPFLPEHSLRRRIGRALRKEKVRRAFRPYLGTRPQGLEQFRDDRTEFGSEILRQIPTADVIHLHWIADFIDYGGFFPKATVTCPVVWTLHDMNPFTGGCHFDGSCGRYTQQCGACPQLGSGNPTDLSHRVWARKRRALDRTPAERLFFVAPSHWLAAEARRSSLFRRFSTTVIPYGIDTRVFHPKNSQDEIRRALDIPEKARVILFLAEYTNNRRKGFALLNQALSELNTRNVFLLSIGKGHPPPAADLPHLHLCSIASDSLLAAIYSLAEVFVAPSIQDNLPNTVLESMACGTPVVGFDTGGIRDMIQDGETGFLVPVEDTTALAAALHDVLKDPAKRTMMSEKCRQKALKEYSGELQAERYNQLYQALSEPSGKSRRFSAFPVAGATSKPSEPPPPSPTPQRG